jgi:hypothetical protein
MVGFDHGGYLPLLELRETRCALILNEIVVLIEAEDIVELMGGLCGCWVAEE